MRIRSLELHGFKSFPDRTVLAFDPGISCIVGPNGCGKSNIVDALRWCIGEQSARSLRGGEMLDVIFAGSEARKPVGFAEVSMTLTTDGGEPFPGEFAQLTEVSVGRRLHRSGQSEYLINQRRVRRRDVVDLFLDTGVGNNLYSFIEQGRIGKIVHARPEERRSLVDEAAGISRYKARRDEAQRRLEATAAQLDRAADVAEEMGRRVRTLSRQVRKAGRFRRLRAQVRQDEVVLAMARYNALAQDRRALRAQLRTAEGELATARRDRARREGDLSARREELSVVEAGVDTWRDEVAEHDARTRELAGTIGFAERRIQELESRREGALKAHAEALLDAEAARGDRLVQEGAAAEAREASEEVSQRLVRLREASRETALTLQQTRASTQASRDLASSAAAAVETAQRDVARLEARAAAWPEQLEAAEALVVERSDQLALAVAAVEAATDRAARARQASTEATTAQAAEQSTLEAVDERVRLAEAALESAQADADAEAEAMRVEAKALQSALREATQAAERDRRAVESRVHTAREAEDARARRLRSQHRGQVQERARQAEKRAQAWIDAVQAHRRAGEAAIRGASVEAERLARRDLQEGLDELEARIGAELEAAVDAARARTAAESLAMESAATEARDALGVATRAVEEARLAVRDAEIQRSSTEARLAAIEAAIAENQASDAGSSAVREAFPELRPLAEHLSPSARSDEALLTRLGGRLLLPVVHHPSQVQAIADLIGEDAHVRVLMRPEGPLDGAAALGAVHLASDLHDALSQEGASVLADGSRVDADGVVHLGLADAAGARLARAASEREALELGLQREIRAVEQARVALAMAEAERDDADLALAEAREAASQLGAALEGELASLRDRARREEDAARQALRDAAGLAEKARVEHLEDQISAIGERARAQAEQARQGRDRALAALETEAAAREEALEVELAASRTAAIDAAREQASKALNAANERLEAARTAVEVHQAGEAERSARSREPVQVCRIAVSEARAELATRREASDRAHRQKADADLFATRAEAAASAAEQAQERGRQALEQARADLETARRDAEATQASLIGAREAQVQAKVRAEQAARQAREASDKLVLAEADRESRAGALSEAEILAATWAERKRSAAQALEALDARDRAIAARIEASERESREAEAGIVEASAALEEAKAERVLVDAARASSWERLERERGRLQELRAGVTEGEGALKQLTETELEATRRVDALSARVSTTREDIDGLRSRMEERYQLSIPGLLDQLDARGDLVLDVDDAVKEAIEIDGHVIPALLPMVVTSSDLIDQDGIEERVQALTEARRALEKIGDVNLAAIEEWADVRERHEDLEAQRADLEASVTRIRSAIAKMNRTCRQRFRDTFEMVNQHFQEMYPRLVGGGSARLALTDEEDLLETGVEIFVQPPGKRLQNLSLLSGGEKAMTAIALILSLFKVKPSPFCVLDEVDAPLDEANGSRFNEALREMSQASQFIVVTHNRKTMECAETLYGITMPQPGCSRLVSVQL